MEKNNNKAWLYLIPAILFLGVFMIYPLVDVLIYSFEEGYNFASQSYSGIGFYNYSYVLHDPYFVQALKNTILLVAITVPTSTILSLLISVGLSKIKPLRNLYQTVFSALCNQYPRSWSCIYDTFQKDRIFRRTNKRSYKCVRRKVRGFY